MVRALEHVPCKVRMRELGSFRLEKSKALVYQSLRRHHPEDRAGLFAAAKVGGQETAGTGWNRRGSGWIEGEAVLPQGESVSRVHCWRGRVASMLGGFQDQTL